MVVTFSVNPAKGGQRDSENACRIHLRSRLSAAQKAYVCSSEEFQMFSVSRYFPFTDLLCKRCVWLIQNNWYSRQYLDQNR